MAINMLIEKYRQPLFRHALYILRDEDEAYDIVQETFIRAIRETRLFDPDFRVKSVAISGCEEPLFESA